MTRRSLLVLALLLSAHVAGAQTLDHMVRQAARWDHPHTADVISNWAVGVAVTVPCVIDRTIECIKHEGIRVGLAYGSAQLTKLLIHRQRPDGSENVSFFSMHTAIACAAVTRSKAWALCPSVGYLRIAADKHWLSDVLTGGGVGLVVSW